MESLVAVVVGFVVGFVLRDLSGAVALGGLAGLFVSQRQLRIASFQHKEQIQHLANQINALKSGKGTWDATTAAQVEPEDDYPHRDSSAISRPASAHKSTLDAAAQPAPFVSTVSLARHGNEAHEPARGHTSQPASLPSSETPPGPPTGVLARFNASFAGKLLAKTSFVTRVGIVILFLGISFLLKYAAQHVSVPIEVRLTSISLVALVVFGLGWRWRSSRREYALLLQGAAVGTWYLVTFAAMKLYPVIPPTLGFVLLTGLSVFAAVMSVAQDARSLAVFGILGGFLAPVLASTGSGNHVMLFSYYAVLNAGIVAIVWFKAWRPLTLMGFAFTFIIAVAWGVTQYRAELFASTEPFLLLFMVFYVTVVMLFALRRRSPPHAFVDGPILFGTPALGFALQTQLVGDFEYGMAWSCLGFGLAYLILAGVWWKLLSARAPLLRESLLAIGVVMLTLAIPYTFDADITALTWALEGAAAIWLATRQQRNWGGFLALVVQVGAGMAWLLNAPTAGEVLFMNMNYAGSATIAVVALWSAWLLRDQPGSFWVRRLHVPMLGWSLLWWFGGAFWQLEAHLPATQFQPAALTFTSLSMLALYGLRMRYQWQTLASVPLFLLVLAVLMLFRHLDVNEHPFAAYGYIAWPLTFVTLYWLYNRPGFFTSLFTQTASHAVSWLTLVGIAVYEVTWQVNTTPGLAGISWSLIAGGTTLLAAIAMIHVLRVWPASLNQLYRRSLSSVLFLVLILYFLLACVLEPGVVPLTYWPVFNPLDIWQTLSLASVWFWWRSLRGQAPANLPRSFGYWLVLVLGFGYLNVLLMRSVHAFADVEFRLEVLLESALVQTGFSILWTVVGISLLIMASRRVKREIWFVGMALIAAVVAKLFLVDLDSTGTVERIVSFITVGLLLLGVGYLAPLPESENRASETETV